MKENKNLFIQIPDPCSEDWDMMGKAGEGKRCERCNNIVYDFSEMNDDQVLNFFTLRPGTHCGRFHNSQLNRAISPLRKANFFSGRFTKMAAVLFTILSVKGFRSLASETKNKTASAYDWNFISKMSLVSDSILISGTIRDDDGNVLENASITFDSLKFATTDSEGRFSFSLDKVSAKSHHLYFTYGDLVTQVRSYHPTMLSTMYDVQLYKKRSGYFHTAGIIASVDNIDPFSVSFKAKSAQLSTVAKKLLSGLALRMKNDPNIKIVLTAYPPICGKQYISAKQVDAVKKYLEEIEGIAAERMATNCEVDAGARDIVEIKAEY